MKKLKLKKEVISKMENTQMRHFKGGTGDTSAGIAGCWCQTGGGKECLPLTIEDYNCQAGQSQDDPNCTKNPDETAYDDLCFSTPMTCESNPGGMGWCIRHTYEWGQNC